MKIRLPLPVLSADSSVKVVVAITRSVLPLASSDVPKVGVLLVELVELGWDVVELDSVRLELLGFLDLLLDEWMSWSCWDWWMEHRPSCPNSSHPRW